MSDQGEFAERWEAGRHRAHDHASGSSSAVPETSEQPETTHIVPPPKAGTPSSGNLRLPDWMNDESGYGERYQHLDAGNDKTERRHVPWGLVVVAVLFIAVLVVSAMYAL